MLGGFVVAGLVSCPVMLWDLGVRGKVEGGRGGGSIGSRTGVIVSNHDEEKHETHLP